MRRATLVATALFGCGAPTDVGVRIEPLLRGARYDLRVFGARVSCDAAGSRAGREQLATERLCKPFEQDTSTTCHLARANVTPDATSRLANIPPGNRIVYGVELDPAGQPFAWACSPAVVVEGQASEVILSFRPN